MVRNLLITVFFIFFFSLKVMALDIVYPASQNVTVNAPSTFFIGNTQKGSVLKINQESVKINDDGVFAHVVPLFYGKNTIKVDSVYKGKKKSLIYVITYNKPSPKKSVPLPYIEKKDGSFLYTKTKNSSATVREKPTSSSKRVIDLPEGTVLYLTGKKGDYYKIDANGETAFWIHKTNVDEPVIVSKKIIAKVKKVVNCEDDFYYYTKIPVSYPALYTLEQNEKQLKLTVYNAKEEKGIGCESGNLEYVFENEDQLLGYDCIYEDGFLILRRAKIADKINPNKPLYGVRIFIDAGHGGKEKGAIGPTRVFEKDINLSICKHLIKLLKQEGAIVSYSRIDDRQVKLYDRVKMAKDNNALISVSIHNNSLPNGKNPYTDHGTETHYYNDNAKVLAYIIKNNLAKDLNLKDNGMHKSSFAMNRSTNPVSVLVEVAYMINPDEYKKLRNNNFRHKVAISITNSLKQYMILLKK